METVYESMYPNGQQVDFIASISGNSSLTLPFSSCIGNGVTTSESSYYPHFKKSVNSERESPLLFGPSQSSVEMSAPLNGCAFTMPKLSISGGNGIDSSYFNLSETHRGSPLLNPSMHQPLLQGMDFNSTNLLNCRDLFCRPQQEAISNGNNLYSDSNAPPQQHCMPNGNSIRHFGPTTQNMNVQQANFDYTAPCPTVNSPFNGNRSGIYSNGNGLGNAHVTSLTSSLEAPFHGGAFNLQPSQTSAPASTRKSSLFWNSGNGMGCTNGQSSTATPQFITSTPIKDATPSSTSLLMFPGSEAADVSNNNMDLYFRQAQERGFIVGMNLEKVLQRSSRCASANNNKILSQFKNRYGEVDSKTRSAYLQLGVRVPSKEHVSEIVGKGGTKIRNLREDTGALITTPGEQEDHVFIIEAPPPVALQVAMFIQQRSDEITQNKAATSSRRLSSVGLGGPIGSNVLGNTHRRLLARDKISVPQDLVGKIIGTQGSIITTIQKDTGTEIRSPPKDLTRDPRGNADFEIAIYEQHNLNTETARQRIYKAKQLIAHLVMRQYEKMEEDEHNNSTTSLLDLSCGSDLNWPSATAGVTLRNATAHRGSLGSHEPPPSQLLQQAATGGSGHNSTFHLMSYWKWPEIEPMNHEEAREVIDRILVESKNKTRKESSGSPELGSASCGTNGGSVYGVTNGSLSQPTQRTLNMMTTADYMGTSATLTGAASSIYYNSNANRTLPNFLNTSFDEPRDVLNSTISTTDGSDILRNMCHGDAAGANNFGVFGQWNGGVKNNSCFNCANHNSHSFDQSPGEPNGHLNSNNFFQRAPTGVLNSMSSSMDALSTGPHGNDSGIGGGVGLMYPTISITYPSADGSIRGLDALSQQLSHSLNLNLQQSRGGPRGGDIVNPQPTFPNFNVPHNFHFTSNNLMSNGSGKRNNENFKLHNDSGFESTINVCHQPSEGAMLSSAAAAAMHGGSIACVDLRQSPIKLDFLEHHSLLFDKSNPWRTGSSSNIDPLIDIATVPPTPEKVGIIGDGRKKTPSPTQIE